MNAAQEARLDAQAKQMAFELGYGADPRQEAPAPRHDQPRHGRALTQIRPATEGQLAFIKRLVDERVVVPGTELAQHLDLARSLVMGGAFTTYGASKLIDALKAAPYKGKEASSAPARELSDGIYVDKDDEGHDHIFKVYVAVHGSGQLCVKRLVVTVDGGRFEYMGLAAKHLPRNARRMSLDEAKAFGAIYGFCVRCGRTLTDDASIAAGIGPICAEQM